MPGTALQIDVARAPCFKLWSWLAWTATAICSVSNLSGARLHGKRAGNRPACSGLSHHDTLHRYIAACIHQSAGEEV
jgi:hypothetical protein